MAFFGCVLITLRPATNTAKLLSPGFTSWPPARSPLKAKEHLALAFIEGCESEALKVDCSILLFERYSYARSLNGTSKPFTHEKRKHVLHCILSPTGKLFKTEIVRCAPVLSQVQYRHNR